MLVWSSGCTHSATLRQHWPHYAVCMWIAGWILRSQCSFTKPYMVKPQLISQISWNPKIHHGSCARLTSSSSHNIPVLWKGWPCILLYIPVAWNNIPHSVKTDKPVDSLKWCLICLMICDCFSIMIHIDWLCALGSLRLEMFAHYCYCYCCCCCYCCGCCSCCYYHYYYQ